MEDIFSFYGKYNRRALLINICLSSTALFLRHYPCAWSDQADRFFGYALIEFVFVNLCLYNEVSKKTDKHTPKK